MLRSGFELHQPALTGLSEFLTPLAHLFSVSHMGISALTRSDWCLQVHGLVQHPLQLRWDDLARFPRQRVLATHECAGNPMFPSRPVRRVGNVEWEGVALADVLEEAGVLPAARYMWSTGADWGQYYDSTLPYYQKDLPVAVAQNGKTLLATHLNGEPLSQERGAPVRLLVPDFYGTNSTKWLVSLNFQEQRSSAHFAKQLYNPVVDGIEQPVWALAPHAVFVSHQADAQLSAGPQLLSGWAWASGGVAVVEVSTDGGNTWHTSTLAERVDHAWQKFDYLWQAPPGAQHVLCRAIANDGRVQPKEAARNCWFGLHFDVHE